MITRIKLLIFNLLIFAVCFGQSVPNTTTFTLQDVTNVVGGTTLSQAFANSVDSRFDPAYKGSKNSLYNFRNYNGASYQSAYIEDTFQRNDCGDGYTGESGIVSLAAGSFTASTQSEADQLAYNYLYTQGYGQSVANSEFDCIPNSALEFQEFTRTEKTSTYFTTKTNITGGGVITERGVVWNTSSNYPSNPPTTSDNKVSNGSGNGTYYITIYQASAFIRPYCIQGGVTYYGPAFLF
jgi:hypothetical protein